MNSLAIHIAWLFVRIRMVKVTGYPYRSIYKTGVSIFDEQT